MRIAQRAASLTIRHIRGKRGWSIAIHKSGASPTTLGKPLPVEQAPAGSYYADPMLFPACVVGNSVLLC